MSSSETECTSSSESVALVRANNHLAVHLHRLLADEKKNVFFSPFSISTAMAMLLCGAEGETAEEIRKALGHVDAGVRKEDVATTFEAQMSALLKNPKSYTLACANALLIQKNFPVKEDYKLILNESFKALLLDVDFQNNNKNVLDQINDWVKEKTNNMIPKFINDIDPLTVLLLLNAVYFKGSWLHKFSESSTFPKKFYNKGIKNKAKDVHMMSMKESFLFLEKESFQALQLPYDGEEISMLVLLPRKRDGLEELELSITPSLIHDFKKDLRKRKVKVNLPRFHLEYSKSLISDFERLGVNRVFVQGELGGINDFESLAVTEIFHKAVLDVNEEGSEAAAATMVAIARCLPPPVPEFIVDHPFLFVIYNMNTDLILFMGRVDEL